MGNHTRRRALLRLLLITGITMLCMAGLALVAGAVVIMQGLSHWGSNK